MNDHDRKIMNWDAFDEAKRPAPETVEFDRVVASAMSRRGFLRSAVAFGSAAAAMGTLGLLSAGSARAVVIWSAW